MNRTVAQLKALGFVFADAAPHAEGCTLVTHDRPFWYYRSRSVDTTTNPEDILDNLHDARRDDHTVNRIVAAGYFADDAVFPWNVIFESDRRSLLDLHQNVVRADQAFEDAKRGAARARDAMRELVEAL